jgi:tRNA-intron endonuclease, archaea type
MQISGELVEDKIIVKKPKDVGRLFNKSHFGKIIKENKLELNILEGVFLLGEGKIAIFKNKEKIDFEKLTKIAAKSIPDFEVKYHTFKGLRNRGHSIKLYEKDENIYFYDFNKKFFVSAHSERDFLKIDEALDLIKKVDKKKKELWLGILDEEGDLTYYSMSLLDIKGKNRENNFDKTKGILLKDRVVIFNKNASEKLHKKEFYGKPFGEGLQLSIVESMYLQEKDFIDIFTVDGKKVSKRDLLNIVKESQPDIKLRFSVFKDLKKQGLLVKTGFKFGAHFRAYTKKPDETHAEYLVHVVLKGFKSTWAEISRAVRLAHSVNKEIAFARVDKNKIDYIRFGRLRP